MNGIDYSSLLNNTGLYSNQTNKDEAAFTGNIAGTKGLNRRAQNKKAADNRQTNADKDTYEYSGQTRDVKAGYTKPKRTESSDYKALDANGVQEGIELSDAAKNLLAELREKYGDMDFAVAQWSSDDEQEYYAGLTDKSYSVLINPELLEKMATDPAAREEYEAIISGAGDKFDTLKEELGEDADKVKGFSITMDKDGSVSYAVKLLKDMEGSSKTEQDRIAQKRAEKKAAEKKATDKKAEKEKTEKEQQDRVVQKKQETEKVEASSIEELIKAIKAKLHPEEADGADMATEE